MLKKLITLVLALLQLLWCLVSGWVELVCVVSVLLNALLNRSGDCVVGYCGFTNVFVDRLVAEPPHTSRVRKGEALH